MTAIQYKTAIQTELEQVPENLLKDLLDYIKEFKKHTAEDIELVNFLKQTLIEDRELTRKTCLMISIEKAVFTHDKLIDRIGGSRGIRDLQGIRCRFKPSFCYI